MEHYGDVVARHSLDEGEGHMYDNAAGCTGELYATCVAWNALKKLELLLREKREHVCETP